MISSRQIFHKIRFLHWLIRAYLKKHALFVLLGLLVGVGGGIKIKDILPSLLTPTQEERIGVIGNYTQNSLPLEIQNLISFGLTTFDQDLKVTSKVAKEFEVKDAGRSYIFKLKEDLFWHDKKPFTAYDINYTFRDVKAKTLNPYKILYELKEPFAPFPSLVAQPLFKKGLIGLGEYKVSSFETEGKFISKLILEKPRKKLLFKFYPNEKAGITGFKLGEINTLWGASDIVSLKDWKNTKITGEIEKNRYVAIFFNTRSGILEEKPFRQALNYVIEGNPIKEKKIYGPVSFLSWAYNPNIKTYDYSLASAQKLLEKTNLATASGSIRLRLTALRPYEKYSQTIARSWKKLGIDTKVQISSLPPANYEALLAAQEIPNDPDQYLIWHSSSKLNITGYNNPRIDKLLEDGRKTIDLEERKKIYHDFQRFLVEDSPAIFLYHPITYIVTRI